MHFDDELLREFPGAIHRITFYNYPKRYILVPLQRYVVTHVYRDKLAYPFELIGSTDDGGTVYIREKWGMLRIEIDDLVVCLKSLTKEELENLDFETIKQSTKDWFEWPNELLITTPTTGSF